MKRSQMKNDLISPSNPCFSVAVIRGEDLHARLTTTRGRIVQSSVLLEKNKLEEEVRQLQKKIVELER